MRFSSTPHTIPGVGKNHLPHLPDPHTKPQKVIGDYLCRRHCRVQLPSEKVCGSIGLRGWGRGEVGVEVGVEVIQVEFKRWI